MTDPSFNENDPASTCATDSQACGRAALLLTESLLHVLIARRLLFSADARDIVQTAVEGQQDAIADRVAPDRAMQGALALLTTMHGSLEADLLQG